jgi:hypothetical protein
MRSLDALLGSLRGCLDGFPDKRRGINTTYSMGDIGMAAFSVFFMQSPSFLAHQRRLEQGHGRSNCASLFGITKGSYRGGCWYRLLWTPVTQGGHHGRGGI